MQKDINLNICLTRYKTGSFQTQPTHYTTCSFQSYEQSTEENTLFRVNFHRSYLKANKVNKSEWTRKIEYAYHFWQCADAVHRKLSKSVNACWNYSLLKLARFLRHGVVLNNSEVAFFDMLQRAEEHS